MRSFEAGFLERQPVTHGLLRTVGEVRQAKIRPLKMGRDAVWEKVDTGAQT